MFAVLLVEFRNAGIHAYRFMSASSPLLADRVRPRRAHSPRAATRARQRRPWFIGMIILAVLAVTGLYLVSAPAGWHRCIFAPLRAVIDSVTMSLTINADSCLSCTSTRCIGVRIVIGELRC